jgi:hypothetical protein
VRGAQAVTADCREAQRVSLSTLVSSSAIDLTEARVYSSGLHPTHHSTHEQANERGVRKRVRESDFEK